MEPSTADKPVEAREPVKPTIKNVDMTEEMQQQSIEIAQTGLDQFQVEKDIASFCKREFDKKYGPTWHVVVGKNFGSYVTHGELNRQLLTLHKNSKRFALETKHFIYFYIGPLAFLIWKS